MKAVTQVLGATAVLSGLLALAGCQHSSRVPAPAADGNVEVEFRAMDEFSDFDDGPSGAGLAAKDYASLIRKTVVDEARRHLRPDQTLTVTFTDIDLAGDHLRSMHSGVTPVRVIEDIYPPRLRLRFRISDADGTVLKQGERTLSDRGFEVRMNAARSGELLYERQLLRDWLRSELG